MNSWFRSAPLPFDHWLGVLALAVGIFLVVELAKWATRRLYGASR